MNSFLETIVDFLGHPAFQGIGAIAGIISIFVSVWLAQNPSLRLKKITIPWRNIVQMISFLLPVYSIFVVSIVFVNALTKNPETLLYGSVALADVLATGWGFVWATYIQKAFLIKIGLTQFAGHQEGTRGILPAADRDVGAPNLRKSYKNNRR